MIAKLVAIAIITWSFYYVVIRPNLAAKPTKKKVKKAAKPNPPRKAAKPPKQKLHEQYVRAFIDGREVYIPIKQIQQ